MSDETNLSVWKTLLQAVKEFWPALVGASFWTAYHWWQLGVIDKPVLIANWCAAFFFVSFITGNWNRIRHQGDTKARLTGIGSAMERFTTAQNAIAETQREMMTVVANLAKQGSQAQPLLAELSRMLVKASVQSTTANTAMMDIVQASISTVGSGYDTGLFGSRPSPYRVPQGTVTIAQPIYVPEDHVHDNQTVNSDRPTEDQSGTNEKKT